MKYSKGKWTKHNLLEKNGELLKYLPRTALYNEDSFAKYMGMYGEAIIKPTVGRLGKDVVKVSQDGQTYLVHAGIKKKKLNGQKAALDYLESTLNINKTYIIQQVIPLAKINECIFDLRVLVQRKNLTDRNWVVTGKLAKVAAKGFVISNAAKEVIPIEQAIEKSSVESINIGQVIQEIDQLALDTAHYLQDFYTKSRWMGLDLGVDQHGKIWIIEVNLRPSIEMFKLLNDPELIELIKSYRRRKKSRHG